MAAKTVTFESKFTNLVLVRQPKLQMPLPTGGWHTTQKTVDYAFQAENSKRGEDGWVGVLRVKEGQDKLSTDAEGWLAPGEEVGVERDAVAALMAHRSFGSRFWISGHEPGTLYPRPADLRGDIRRWSVALDADALEAALAAERSTHQRADLVTELADALTLVQEERAKMQAAAEKAEAEQAAPKAKAKPKAPAAT